MAKKSKYYVRPDGNHESIRTINGKRVAFRGKTDREVDRKILAYQEKAEAGRTVAQVADAWQREKESEVCEATRIAYRAPTKKLKAALGERSIKSILPIDLKRYIDGLGKQGLAFGTMNLRLVVVNQVFDYAVMHSDIDISPAVTVHLPKNLPRKTRVALTAEEIRAVTECREENWLLGLVLLYTGCRRGEVMALRYEDIDRKAGVIHINKKYSYATYIPTLEQHTKTDAGMRDIPLLTPLADALPKNRIGLIFHETDGKPIRAHTLARRWKAYCREVGFVETDSQGGESFPVTPHCFRHTFATICYDAGVDIKSAANLMGHANEKITMELYTHLSQSREQITADKLNAFISIDAAK